MTTGTEKLMGLIRSWGCLGAPDSPPHLMDLLLWAAGNRGGWDGMLRDMADASGRAAVSKTNHHLACVLPKRHL